MLGHSSKFKIQQGFQNIPGKYHPSVDCLIGWYDWHTGETRGEDSQVKQTKKPRERKGLHWREVGNAKYVVVAPHFRCTFLFEF